MNGTIAPNLFDRLASRWGRATKATPQPGQLYRAESGPGGLPTYPMAFTGWPDRSQDPTRRVTTDLERAKIATTTSAVYTAINTIAQEISAAELRVTERAGEEVVDVENHPLELLWQSPNPFMSRSFFVQYWTWQLLLFGKAFIYLAPRGGSIGELWPVPSAFMRADPDPAGFIGRYLLQVDASKVPTPIDARYIVYSRLPHPFDPHDGLSPLAAAFTAVQTDNAMAGWNLAGFSRDNARPSAVISTKPEMQDVDFQRFRTEMLDFYGSGQRKTLIARGGDVDVKLLAYSPEQMQFGALRDKSTQEIHRVFGIPDGYFSEKSNRANSGHATSVLTNTVIWPKLVMLGEDFTSQCGRWWFPGVTIGFDDIREEDRQLQLQEFQAYQAVLTVNELRQRIKVEPFPDDDPRGVMLIVEVAKGTPSQGSPAEAIVTDNMAEAEAAAPPPEPEAPPPMDEPPPTPAAAMPVEAEAPEAPALPEGKALDLSRWEAKAIKALKAGRPASVPFHPDALDATEAAPLVTGLATAATREEVAALFDAARFRAEAKKAGLTPAEQGLSDTLADLLGKAGAQAARTILNGGSVDLSGLSDSLRAALVPALTAVVLERTQALETELGTGADVDPAPWVADYVPTLTAELNQTTVAAIAAVTATPGMDRAALVTALQGAFGARRAETIALTSITEANSQAVRGVGGYLASQGVDIEYVWQTNNDEMVCLICGDLDGTVVSADELPPAHPRCRCGAGARVKRGQEDA